MHNLKPDVDNIPKCENLYHQCLSSFVNSGQQPKCFTIFQLNVCGINNVHKFDKIKIMLARIPSKCDIIMLCETKLKSSFPSGIYNLNGYDRYACSRESKNSGGDILLFVKKDILIVDKNLHHLLKN